MTIESVRNLLWTNDGSLPDINFDFGASRVAGDAYALLQSRASCLAFEGAYYWSRSRGEECPIRFGENPALALLEGDAEAFHVVFSGVRSSTGAPIPNLGVFVLDIGFIALDYRMGPAWDEAAILGLFEIMRELATLSSSVKISHIGNIFESEQGTLLSEFERWKAVNSQVERTER